MEFQALRLSSTRDDCVGLERSDLLDTHLGTASEQIESQIVGELRAAPQWRLCPRLPRQKIAPTVCAEEDRSPRVQQMDSFLAVARLCHMQGCIHVDT